MIDAEPIAQPHVAAAARPAAVAPVATGGKRCAKDAMLRVEHRKMLADDDFQRFRRNRGAEGQNLLRRTIVGGRDAAGAQPPQPVHAQFVCRVEGEIGDKRVRPVRQSRSRSKVAGQEAVRPQTQQRLDRFRLAGFLHPRRRQEDGGAGGPGPRQSPPRIGPRREDRR